MTDKKSLRKHLLYLLEESGAHVKFEDVVKDVPSSARGTRPQGAAHSLWELLEHMRIAQWDILEFIRDPKHESPEFPSGYWPKKPAPPSPAAWTKSVRDFLADRGAMSKLIKKKDLFAKIRHGDGQTILREALLAADHNSYTLGEMVLTRRLLGIWKSK